MIVVEPVSFSPSSSLSPGTVRLPKRSCCSGTWNGGGTSEIR